MILNRLIRSFSLTLLLAALSATCGMSQTIIRDNTPAPKDKDYYFMQGVRLYNLSDYANSKEAFSKILELEPENDAAYYYLSNISLSTNDIVSAEVLLEKAIELDPDNYWYKSRLAQIYLSTKRAKEAVAIYEGLIELYPKKKDIYYNLANIYVSLEDLDKSREVLDRIEKIGGITEPVVLTKFNLYRMAQDMEGALKYLNEVTKESATPRIETLLGDLYADRYNDSLAMVHYEKALKLEPDYPLAIYGEAEIYRQKGNTAEFFKKITSLVENRAVVPQMKNEYLGQLLQLQHFVQKNKTQLDTVMNTMMLTHPADSATAYIASAYFAQTGNDTRCKEILQELHRQYPDSPTILTQYLSFLYFREEWETLEKEAAKAVEKNPSNNDYIQLLGISQFQTDKTLEAIETYKKMESLALKNNDTTNLLNAYSLLGDLNHEANNAKLSYAYYKKALKINPSYNPVLNNYAYFLALENKNLKEAYKMSLKTVESEPDNPTYLDTFAWILYLMDKPVEAKAHLKHAMLYGGKESAAILDHYAEVLYALKEYDLAFIYWEQAHAKDNTMGIKEKIRERKAALKK